MPPEHPVRADAVRNRENILEIAHEAFAADGSVSLNAIAKRAGVGPGTLYRHFPTREDLILAVYQHDVLTVSDAVDKLLADHEPLDAFRLWFEELAGYVKLKHGLGAAFTAAAIQDVVNATYAPVIAAVRKLVAACERDGSLRTGLDPADILLLMEFMWRGAAGAEGEAQARRVMELVIEGLRPRG
jgi:AcrR family transcriptional regulator